MLCGFGDVVALNEIRVFVVSRPRPVLVGLSRCCEPLKWPLARDGMNLLWYAEAAGRWTWSLWSSLAREESPGSVEYGGR